MAIWPFGRKSKRHTIQLGEPHHQPQLPDQQPHEQQPHDQPQEDEEQQPQQQHQQLPDSMPLEPRLTRKKSKRQKNRHSQPVLLPPPSASLHDVVATRSVSSHPPPPRTALSEQQQNQQNQQQYPRLVKQRNPRFDDLYSSSRAAPHHPPAMSRSASLKGSNNSGHAVLKKRISQRKMNKIAREQEIRLMASSPIDIPRRHGQSHGQAHGQAPGPGQPDHLAVAPVRRGLTHSRRAERHRSDTSLSNRDSASSLSEDFSGTNTFKVNALAAFTPRPLIRYVDPPRLPSTSRSQNASAASTRRERLPALTVSEENLSKRRIDRLADDLDAGGLRELLERDRRRQELKIIRDNERAQRKLERSAERQRRAESAPETEPEPEPAAPEASEPPLPKTNDEEAPRDNQPGSWLRDASREPRSNRQSVESANVIGNIDDSSIREPRTLAQQPSFARSQDLGVSRTTLSPAHSHTQSQSQSPSRHGVASPTSSLIYGMARESMSDASRTVDSEQRMSDHSGRRMNTFSSLFRRGSSRLKRTYRERFQDTSDLSNASHPSAHHVSHESFSKIPTQSSAPAASLPPRPFNRSTGTIKRAQSKFTEHFGDEPLSPPDSRLQSPDIMEEPTSERRRGIPIGTAYPIPGSDPDLPSAAAARNRHQRSWITDHVDDAESQNLPLSRSLASIDSEGSWMSGHFLRRISQRKSHHPVRHSTGQFEQSPADDDYSLGSEQPFVRFSSNNEEEERTSGDNAPEPEPVPAPVPVPISNTRSDVPRLSDEDPAETWHTEVGRRPVLVNPTVRPKSTEGLLKNVQTLSPLSVDEDFGPIEEHAAELDYATDEDS